MVANIIIVVGAADPYLHGSLALYNVCDEDNAVFFDHGKGHTLPRDQQTIKELANVIRSMIDETTSSGTATPESMNDWRTIIHFSSPRSHIIVGECRFIGMSFRIF